MKELWAEVSDHLEDLRRGLYVPSDVKELTDVSLLVLETALSVAGRVRGRINLELRDTEPLCLIAATALFFLATYTLRRLCTYDGFIPSNKRKGILERIRKLPILRSLVAKQMSSIKKDLEKDLKKDFGSSPFKLSLPEKGFDVTSIEAEVRSYLDLCKVNWKGGAVSGAIYSPNDITAEQMLLNVYAMTMKSNHLHADVFPGIRKMEAEIIRWVIKLFNGDDDACGAISSGGTESIVLACKAYRDYALSERGVTRPEIVVPVTAHAAFDKAADWLRLEIRKVPLNPKTMQVDVRKMRSMINKNTIMIVGSAPGYPHGIVDPIEEISELGWKYGVPVHVDCCLGGFIMPFMDEAGYPVRPFDFRLRGVTSISADTHKYAMAPKGTSVIMYSDRKFLHCQFSVAGDWPGGIYITPTISGSRSGAVVACCWAALRYHGRQGYVKACRDIVTEARKIKHGIQQFEGLRLLGDPQASVVAFTSDAFNIFELSARLGKLGGWHLNPLQYPSGVHFTITAIHTQNNVADRFLQDLKQIAQEMLNDPNKKVSSQAAVYGLAQTIPDRSIVKELLFNYQDVIYSTEDLRIEDQAH